MLKVVTQIRFLPLWWPSGLFGAVKEDPQPHKTNTKDFQKIGAKLLSQICVKRCYADSLFAPLVTIWFFWGCQGRPPTTQNEHKRFPQIIWAKLLSQICVKSCYADSLFVILVTTWSFWGCQGKPPTTQNEHKRFHKKIGAKLLSQICVKSCYADSFFIPLVTIWSFWKPSKEKPLIITSLFPKSTTTFLGRFKTKLGTGGSEFLKGLSLVLPFKELRTPGPNLDF